MKKTIISLSLFTLLNTLHATSINEANKFFKSGDFNSAFYYYSKSAEINNNKNAQFMLYKLFNKGKGVVKNDKTAIIWLKKAAFNNHLEAQYLLYQYYFKGTNSLKINANKGLQWLETSANLNYPKSQYDLGMLYLNGYVVDKNIKKAYKWLIASANHNYVEAQYQLGLLFLDGKFIEKDLKRAFNFFKAAAKNNKPEAIHNLGIFYLKGEIVNKDYEKALSLFTTCSIKYNLPQSQYYLANMYLKGLGTNKDINQAIYFYQKSAAQDYTNSQYNLAIIYYKGIANEYNLKKAFNLFKKVAIKGNKKAQYFLAQMYEKGDGITKDFSQAEYWYAQSRNEWFNNKENKEIDMKLAQILLPYEKITSSNIIEDIINPTDENINIVNIFKNKSLEGDNYAQNKIAEMYYEGKLLEQDYKKSIYWYKQSIENGFLTAKCDVLIPLLSIDKSDKTVKKVKDYLQTIVPFLNEKKIPIEDSYCKNLWTIWEKFNLYER